MTRLTFALVALLTVYGASAVDRTEEPGAAGDAVRDEVLARLIPAVFPFEYDFLKRVAIGGEAVRAMPPSTPKFLWRRKFQTANEAKIWPLTQTQFEATQTDPNLQELRALVKTKLGVDWTTDVTFDTDGAKPLHSAIASMLHAYSVVLAGGKDLLPRLLEDQVDLWATEFIDPPADTDQKTEFVTAVNEAETKAEELCNSKLDVVFLFDLSMTAEDSAVSRTKVKNLVTKYNDQNSAQTSQVRFGLANYWKQGFKDPGNVLPLTLTKDPAELEALVDSLKAPGNPANLGSGDIAGGLVNAIQMHGARTGVPEVIVLVSSGMGNLFDDPQLQTALDDAASKGIRVIALWLFCQDDDTGAKCESTRLEDVVSHPALFIDHLEGAEDDKVNDLLTRAINFGSCQTNRAPEPLNPGDAAQRFTFKEGESKRWTKDFAPESPGVTLSIRDANGLGLGGWGCYECERPSEAFHEFEISFTQDNKIEPKADARAGGSFSFAIRAERGGDVDMIVQDIPKPTEPPTVPTTEPTTAPTESTGSPSQGTSSSTVPPSSEGTGSPETPAPTGVTGTTEFTSTSGSKGVFVAPLLLLVSVCVGLIRG